MKRAAIVGSGASGKSTLALRLGEATGLPVIELDKVFWQADLTPMSRDEWTAIQHQMAGDPAWIMDGDLGPYDVIEPRLLAADTIIVLDVSAWRCTWRAARRSRERADFWRWIWRWRRQSRPVLLEAIAANAPGAEVHVLRNTRAVEEFLARCLESG